jgi:hypothetical protein
MGENSEPNAQLGLDGTFKGELRDEEHPPRLGELYQDINEFTETKHKIEALLRLKKSLGQDNSNLAAISDELKRYRLLAMEAIDRLFSTYIPDSNTN